MRTQRHPIKAGRDETNSGSTIRRSKGREVFAELTGEEMLQFRTGKDLWPFCKECSNSAVTPVTHVVGCQIGDDPDVQDYAARIDSGKTSIEIEKCPGFTPKALEDPAIRRASSRKPKAELSEAGFLKEVPSGPQPVSTDFVLLEDLLATSPRKPPLREPSNKNTCGGAEDYDFSPRR